MAEPIGDIATKAAAAITGPDTPSTISVKRPAEKALWSLFATLAAVCVMEAGAIYLLAYGWPVGTADGERVRYLFLLALALAFDLLIIVFAIASPWVGRAEVSAGSKHIELEGR